MLYNHFLKRLESKIADFGRAKMEASVSELRILRQRLEADCKIKRWVGKKGGVKYKAR